ncbi:unnamed protein product [Malus baccata var. baccata]
MRLAKREMLRTTFLYKTKRKMSPRKRLSSKLIDAIAGADIKEAVGLTENTKETKTELPDWIPAAPNNSNANNMKQKVIFVLDKASLTLVHVGNIIRGLNPDHHADFMRKKKLDPYVHRPDIVHDALHQIMTSRLCMSGRLEAVYIKTDCGVLIEVSPRTAIPASLDKFCDLMSKVLQDLRVAPSGKSVRGGMTLFRLVKNPVTRHLPVNSFKVGLSCSAMIWGGADVENLVFVVGAMARGAIDSEYLDDLVSVSGDHLSAASCLSRICIALERKWNIL